MLIDAIGKRKPFLLSPIVWWCCVVAPAWLALPHYDLVAQGTLAPNQANVRFLPGDAFFHTYLSDELLGEPTGPADNFQITYYQPKMSGSLGFSAGFRKLKITGVNSAVRQAIVAYHDRTHENEDRIGGERVQENDAAVHSVFVYPKDRDFSTQRLGVKYNEAWRRLQGKMLRKDQPPVFRRFPAYVTFISSAEAVIEDWRNSGEFAPLAVDIPPESGDPFLFGSPIDIPISVAMNDIVLVVVQSKDIEKCFRRLPRATWSEIDSHGNTVVKQFDRRGFVEVLESEP